MAAALAAPAPLSRRLAALAPWVAVPVATLFLVSAEMKPATSDVVSELSGNGAYEFFAAFRNNELSYPRFYATLPSERVLQVARELVGGDDPYWIEPAKGGMHRVVFDPRPDLPLNVVLVSVESLGAEFLGSFGNREGLTPNLDALATRSLFFSQVYATGNRTCAAWKRSRCRCRPRPAIDRQAPAQRAALHARSVFEDRGFDTAFVYGGYGYFDNLNYFFSNNDYRVVDRTALAAARSTTRTSGGCRRGPLHARPARDGQVEEGRRQAPLLHARHDHQQPPALHLPAGPHRHSLRNGSLGRGEVHRLRDRRIPPQGEGPRLVRRHGVRDHRRPRRSARGTQQIRSPSTASPLMITRRSTVTPGRFERLMSQIDIGPTLLGLMNMGYSSKFYGHDVFQSPPEADRALVGNYQTLGYMKDWPARDADARAARSAVPDLPRSWGCQGRAASPKGAARRGDQPLPERLGALQRRACSATRGESRAPPAADSRVLPAATP
jgi:hypothetical protein